VACVVTDIEMPQMDGYHLTKLIKDDPILRQLPVILFSSIINDDVKNKGLQVGADAQISKPQIANLVTVIDGLTTK
jgi:two-component system chemotaxis response regulator CheV